MPGRKLGKRAVLSPDVPEVGLAERRSVDRAFRPRLPYLEQAARVAKGKGSQQRRVKDAEHHGARTHAEREHQGPDDGQARVSAEPAPRLPHLGREGIEGGAEANVAHTLLDLVRTAQLEQSFAPGYAWISSRAQLLVHQHVLVGADLFIEVRLDARALYEVAPHGAHAMPERHDCPRKATVSRARLPSRPRCVPIDRSLP